MKILPKPLVTIEDVLANFQQNFDFNLKLLRDFFDLQAMEVMPDATSPFYLETPSGPRSLHLLADSAVAAPTLFERKGDAGLQVFYRDFLSTLTDHAVLVDIGAGTGLFARECLSRNELFAAIYCYEPDPASYRLLALNLGGLPGVHLERQALGGAYARATLYASRVHPGMASLDMRAIDGDRTEATVEVTAASACEAGWRSHGKAIFYHSHTRGSDVQIAASLSPAFWHQVRAGVIEPWRLPGEAAAAPQLQAMLDAFPSKVWRGNPGQPVSSADVIAWIGAQDGRHDQLLFWR